MVRLHGPQWQNVVPCSNISVVQYMVARIDFTFALRNYH